MEGSRVEEHHEGWRRCHLGLIFLTVGAGMLVDWLWFADLGYLGVVWVRLATKASIFFAALILPGSRSEPPFSTVDYDSRLLEWDRGYWWYRQKATAMQVLPRCDRVPGASPAPPVSTARYRLGM
jgi:hypothetical protein